jgi:hypothetical protein
MPVDLTASVWDWGTCPHCGRNRRLRKDGTMRHHGGEKRIDWDGRERRDYRCPGTGQRPNETTDDRR